MIMKFKASLDTLAKILTACIIICFVVIGFGRIRAIAINHADTTALYVNISIIVFFILIVVFTYLFAPQAYMIDNDELVIKRPIKDKKIKFLDIKGIRIANDFELNRAIRTFGVGGMFGYFGKFYCASLGSMTFYATQRKNRVIIQTKQGRIIIITPDDLQIVNLLKEKITGN